MNIWRNAFKSGGKVAGTGLTNGSQSRISLSSLNTSGRATIAFSVTTAIVALLHGRVSVGVTEEGALLAECKSSKGGKRYLIKYSSPSIAKYFKDRYEAYDPTKEKKLTVKVINEEGYVAVSPREELVSDNFAHWSLFIPRIVEAILESGETGEFAICYKTVLESYLATGEIKSNNELFIMNDYLYESRHNYIQGRDEINHLEGSAIIVDDWTKMFANKDGEYDYVVLEGAKTTTEGKSAKEELKEEKADVKPKAKKTLKVKSDYFLDWDRELTEEEKKLIPNMNFEIIRVSREIRELAAMIKGEIDSLNPVRNILLYGGAGAGKSTGSRVLAQLLGVPYRFVTCSLNTEESDFIGDYAPNEEGGFDFIMPAFAETFKNGGVIEVQEPTTLKAGVGVALNSATDDTNKITLRNGEVVERHKNCIIVFTTNVEYSGCNRMNGSVKSRFQQKLHIEKLPNEELIKIIVDQSGNKDVALIRKLIDAVDKIALKIEEEHISDGTCSTRELIDWARDIRYTKDPIRSARKTVIPSVSFDLEVQEEIVESILEPLF